MAQNLNDPADLISNSPSSGQVATWDAAGKTKWKDVPAAPVTSVAGRGGAVVLAEADVAGLVSDLANLSSSVASCLKVANNLSDLPSAVTARTNLGLGSVLNAKQVTSINLVTGGMIYATPLNWTVDGAGAATATLILNSQSANQFLSGPTGGIAATPTWRGVAAADLGSGATGSLFLRGDMTWAMPVQTTPAGSGTELQYRNGSAFGALSGSSVSGANVTLGGTLAAAHNTLDDSTGKASFAGFVGIGTSVQTSANETIRIKNPATAGSFLLNFGNGNAEGMFFLHTGSTSNFAGYGAPTQTVVMASDYTTGGSYRPLALASGGLARILITTSGRVLVGTNLASDNGADTLQIGGSLALTSGGNTLSKFDANGQLTTYGTNTTLSNLSVPTGLSVTPQGTTGATSYGYAVTAVNAQGETVASSTVTTATGNATLSSSNKNHLAFNASNGATSYNVYRQSGGATQGKIGSVTGTGATAYTFDDTGLAASGTAPTAQTGTGLTITSWAGQTADTLGIYNSAGVQQIEIDPAGNFAARTSVTIGGFGTGILTFLSATKLGLGVNGIIGWCTAASGNGTVDVGLTRAAPNILQITAGPTGSTYGFLDARIRSFAVASLPTAGNAGRIAWASDGRNVTQGAAAGTGCLVTDDGTIWRAVWSGVAPTT